MSEPKPLSQCFLYTFVDAAYLGGRSAEAVTAKLCDGGVDLIQLRAKNLPIGEVSRMAERIVPIARQAGVWLVINDYPSIALSTGAPVCHLGQEDFFGVGYSRCSALVPVGRDLKIGLSTHAPDQASRSVVAGADYIAVGPIYRTETKPSAQPTTLEYVRWAAANLTLPWFAIGGINMRNLDAVLEAGARRVCVVSAILNSGDITLACHEFKDRLVSAAFADEGSHIDT